MKKTLVSIVAASLLALNFTGCGSSKKEATPVPTDNGKEVKVAELGNVLGATVSVNGMNASEMASGYYKFASTPMSGKITSTGGKIDLNNNGVIDTDEEDADAPNMSSNVNSAAMEDLVTPFTTLVVESGMTASEVASILEINESDLNMDTSTITSDELKKKVILATAIINSASDTNGRSLRGILPGTEDSTTVTTTEATPTPTPVPVATVTTTVATKTIAQLLASINSEKATVGLYKAVANVTGISEMGDLETATDLTVAHKAALKKPSTSPGTTLPTPPPTPTPSVTITPTIPPTSTPTPTPTISEEPTPTPTVSEEPTPTPTSCGEDPFGNPIPCDATPTPEPTSCGEDPFGNPIPCSGEATPTPEPTTTDCGEDPFGNPITTC